MHAYLLQTISIEMQARSLRDHLSAADSTARFAEHAQRLLRLQRLLETALPPALRTSARVANLRQGKLIIHAANSAVAAKLRQFGPRFTEVFLNNGAQLSEIDIKVQARARPAPSPGRERPALPSETRKQALAQLARDLPGDSAIGSSLESLLRRLKEQ